MTGRVSVTEYQTEAEALGQLCFISIKVGADGQEAIQSSYSQRMTVSTRERVREKERVKREGGKVERKAKGREKEKRIEREIAHEKKDRERQAESRRGEKKT